MILRQFVHIYWQYPVIGTGSFFLYLEFVMLFIFVNFWLLQASNMLEFHIFEKHV